MANSSNLILVQFAESNVCNYSIGNIKPGWWSNNTVAFMKAFAAILLTDLKCRGYRWPFFERIQKLKFKTAKAFMNRIYYVWNQAAVAGGTSIKYTDYSFRLPSTENPAHLLFFSMSCYIHWLNSKEIHWDGGAATASPHAATIATLTKRVTGKSITKPRWNPLHISTIKSESSLSQVKPHLAKKKVGSYMDRSRNVWKTLSQPSPFGMILCCICFYFFYGCFRNLWLV